ncbi:MAG: glycosyltransferase family 2 protein [Chitinophagaceae bacterium]|nr:MAG: glycosyltransferase family 2 protein [Chitinophagaceae bacterium]
MDVSIVIINYKTYRLTCDCIESVLAFTKDLAYEIILVENGSDEFKENQTYPWGEKVRIVISRENLGFAGGNNLGIKYTRGKYILLLNSDTYLKDNAIKNAFHYIERHQNTGVVSAKLVFPDGRHQSVAQRFPSVKYKLFELLRLQKLLPAGVAGKLLLGAFFDHKTNTSADWVWGAFFMFRSEILKMLPEEKLDDTYFMYFEDMQWCMDIRNLGYEIHYCAEAEVVHIMGGSSANKNALMLKNEQVFMNKNYSAAEMWMIEKLDKMLAS